MKKHPTLYKRTELDQVQQWTIFSEDDKFWTEEGIQGGKITRSEPTICEGKNLGKKNETSPTNQADKEAEAKFKKKLKEKYHENIDDIDEEGFFEPILCEKYLEQLNDIDFSNGVAIEEKLNGTRAVFTKNGAFSRTGEQYHCVFHIIAALKPIFEKYPNAVIDGELFNNIYKNKLNRIASLVSVNRKPKDITIKDIEESEAIVQFHVYDGFNFENITKNTPYVDRKDAIKNLLMGVPCCFYHPYKVVYSDYEVRQELQKTKEQKIEGLVVKILNGKYENKRSKNFLKFKNFVEEDFEFLYFEEGKGNWKGKVKRVICKLNVPATTGETTFKSNIRGSMKELEHLWNTRDEHENKQKKCTVIFQEYSEYGIPQIPYTGLPFRDYE